MTQPIHSTREAWLAAAVEELRPVFAATAAPIAARIRVACGFPSNARRSGAVGECWADTASADKTMEILISPTVADPAEVLAILIHELAHTTAGALNHGKAFANVCDQMGLVPDAAKGYKATSAGPQFDSLYAGILSGLEAYPHAELALSTKKTQSTRMLKCWCAHCGYTVRTTAKWLVNGAPLCGCLPQPTVMLFDPLPDADGADSE